MKKLCIFYYKYRIFSLQKCIKKSELNIYFDGWTGAECIDNNNYLFTKIKVLKLKLKNYEK
jgi:hypothetical protein